MTSHADTSLHGRSVLITGGTSGIGRGLVECFRDEGAHVCFTGRRAEEGEKISDETGAKFVAADVRDATAIPKIVEAAMQENGRIDVLINNAGNPGPIGAIEDIDLEALDETLSIHMRGSFAMCQGVIPAMKRQRSGVILNTSSITGHRVGGHSPVYAMAKAGIGHFTRYAAAELGQYGIRVNTLSPGFIPTEIHGRAAGRVNSEAQQFSDAIAPMFIGLQAIPRKGTIEDVCKLAVFLSSDAASFITGIDLLVDGGLSLGRGTTWATRSASLSSQTNTP